MLKPQRRLGPFGVSALGLGCMNLSHAYGTPPDERTGAAVLRRALELGYTHLDTAALYGFGANEELIGRVLPGVRDDFVLASKCALFRNDEGRRALDGSPEAVRRTCEQSLRRLRRDTIDLYYLHRWDRRYPIEDCVGVMADLKREGKIRAIGLSEVSAATLRRAHAEHPIAALQTEYSLWTRNPEIAVLDACRELGVGFVAFSPLGRGILTGGVRDMGELPDDDIRQGMPRFQGDNFRANRKLVEGVEALARDQGCTPAQLALAWVLAQGEHIVPIPGTTSLTHLEENAKAADVRLEASVAERLAALFDRRAVAGLRYPASSQAEIDTEQFPEELAG